MESETPLISCSGSMVRHRRAAAASAGGFSSASGETNRPHSFFTVKSASYFTFFMYLLLIFATSIDLVFVDPLIFYLNKPNQ